MGKVSGDEKMKETKQRGDNEWNKKILGNKKVLGKIISSPISGGKSVFSVNTIKSAIKGKSRLLYCQVLVPPASCKILTLSSHQPTFFFLHMNL